MGLFGDVDAEEISDDPFFVGAGTYETVVTEANIIQPKDDTKKPGLAVKFQITDEDTEFHGLNVSTWNTVYLEPLTEDEKRDATVKRNLSFLKARLGDLGISEEDMDTLDENLDSLVGNEYYVTVKESPNDDGRVFSNVTKIEPKE